MLLAEEPSSNTEEAYEVIIQDNGKSRLMKRTPAGTEELLSVDMTNILECNTPVVSELEYIIL